MNRSKLTVLTEVAIMIALTAVLSNVTLFKLPQGGSVTAGSMVPILLVGIRHGLKWGLFAGLAAGLVNLIVDPFVVHPVQAILDYPLAFAALGLSGLAAGRSNFAAASLGSLALAGRFLAHTLSGVVFFAEYAGDQNVWVYSIIYNGSYMIPELIISAALVVMLLPVLQRTAPATATRQAA